MREKDLLVIRTAIVVAISKKPLTLREIAAATSINISLITVQIITLVESGAIIVENETRYKKNGVAYKVKVHKRRIP